MNQRSKRIHFAYLKHPKISDKIITIFFMTEVKSALQPNIIRTIPHTMLSHMLGNADRHSSIIFVLMSRGECSA